MKTKTKFIIAAIVLVIFIFVSFNNPNNAKEAVADLEGAPCLVDNDCPCIGTYNYTTIDNPNAFGIGTAKCDLDTLTCDMTFCVGLESVGTWTKDNIWMFLKANPLMFIAILALLIMAIKWPKV